MTEIIWHKTYLPEYFINIRGQVRTFDRCEYTMYKNSLRKSHRKGKILNPIKMNNGYLCVDMCHHAKIKKELIHRLMAKTFFNEDLLDKHIHHIDGNKENNAIFNLKVIDSKLHCKEHSFNRVFKNKTGYRGVHEYYNGKYRGSIQRSGQKTIYTKVYDSPEKAYDEIQNILKSSLT